MIELTKDQLDDMKRLRDVHLAKHRELQPIQAIQELCELSQELTNYLIRIKLRKEINYLVLYNELFDAYSLLLAMYQMFVIDMDQVDMFRIIASQKIDRELKRWNIK